MGFTGGFTTQGVAPSSAPELVAEGNVVTVDVQSRTVVSYTLSDNHRYVVRFKTTAWDASGNGSYWEHVMVASRINGPASLSQDAEVVALETSFPGVALTPTPNGNAVQMDVIGDSGVTISWETKIYVESDRAV